MCRDRFRLCRPGSAGEAKLVVVAVPVAVEAWPGPSPRELPRFRRLFRSLDLEAGALGFPLELLLRGLALSSGLPSRRLVGWARLRSMVPRYLVPRRQSQRGRRRPKVLRPCRRLLLRP